MTFQKWYESNSTSEITNGLPSVGYATCQQRSINYAELLTIGVRANFRNGSKVLRKGLQPGGRYEDAVFDTGGW